MKGLLGRMLDAISRALHRHALLWFLLLGAMLFAVDHLRRQPPPLTPPPGLDEGAARQWLEEEVLYREASRRGLGEGDLIVRRRMAQKMRALLETAATVAPPTDAELQAFMAAAPARYGGLERLDFDHVFLSRGERPAAGATDIQALRERLPDMTASALRSASDPHPAGVAVRGAPFRDLERWFGTSLATHVAGLPVGNWHGPIASSLGTHFVRVTDRRLHALDVGSARQQAQQDWLQVARAEKTRAAIDALMAAHGVVPTARAPDA